MKGYHFNSLVTQFEVRVINSIHFRKAQFHVPTGTWLFSLFLKPLYPKLGNSLSVIVRLNVSD